MKQKILFVFLFLLSSALAVASGIVVSVVPEQSDLSNIPVGSTINMLVKLESGKSLYTTNLVFGLGTGGNFEFPSTGMGVLSSEVYNGGLSYSGLGAGKWTLRGGDPTSSITVGTNNLLGKLPIKVLSNGVLSLNLVSSTSRIIETIGDGIETSDVEYSPITLQYTPVTVGTTGQCTAQCGARVCGPDPTCSQSCGSCANGQTCNAQGMCITTNTCTATPATCDQTGVSCPGNGVITATGCPTGQTCTNHACVLSGGECVARAATACVAGVGCPGDTNIPATGCPAGQSCSNGACTTTTGVTVSTGTQTTYTLGNTIIINVGRCTGTSLLTVSNSTGSIVDMKQGSGSWTYNYNTESSDEGTYTLKASCDNPPSSNSINVNVRNMGLATTCTLNYCSSHGTCSDASGAPICTCTDGYTGARCQTIPSGGGGGRRCTSEWSCSLWSICSASLTQTRTCQDLNQCEKTKVETRSCSSCQESWTCSDWSSCANGVQTRTCQDERSCGTSTNKPKEQQSCSLSSQQQQQLNYPQQQNVPPTIEQPGVAPKFSLSKIWEKYQIYFLSGGGAILLIIILLIVLAIIKYHRPAGNVDELISWIQEERKIGSSETQIREALKNTNWKESEINKAFGKYSGELK